MIYRTIIVYGLSIALLTLGSATRSAAQLNPSAAVPELQAARVIELPRPQRNGEAPVITAVSLSADGLSLASGGDDHVVRLWNARTGDLVRELKRHTDWVRQVVFAPQGPWIASGGDDHLINLWNTELDESRTLPGLPMPTYRVAWSPDHRQLAEAGFEDKIRLYSIETGQPERELEAPSGDIRALSYSHDGSLLAAAGRNGKIRIWKTVDFSVLHEIDAHRQRVRAIAFSPDDTQLASGGDDRQLIVWDPQLGAERGRLPVIGGKIQTLVYLSNETLASGATDNVIRVWDLPRRQELLRLVGHTGSVVALDYHAPSGLLVSGSFDTSIRLWYPAETDKARVVESGEAPAVETNKTRSSAQGQPDRR